MRFPRGRFGYHVVYDRDLYADALSSAIRGIVADAGGVQVCVENEPLTPFVEEVLEGLLSEEEGLF